MGAPLLAGFARSGDFVHAAAQATERGPRMKNILLFLALMSLTPSALASDKKTVSYKSGDETVQGILYTPQGKGPFPALIVIHEWWGLNDWVNEQASKFADEGYAALA